jgi:hypothetical protein
VKEEISAELVLPSFHRVLDMKVKPAMLASPLIASIV